MVELFLTSVPEFSVVFRFRAYSRRHETEPESISPQDVLRQRGRRARWLLRDGAVQRESAVQRVTKIGILERGRSLGLVGLLYITIYFVPVSYTHLTLPTICSV